MNLIESMEVFVRVVEEGSFVAAADATDISATMVGKHIRYLEERVGARLLNRTTRRQSLTEAGQMYYERCKHVLAEIEQADASVHVLNKKPVGTLRVASPVTFGAHRLTPEFATYLRLHEEVTVDLTLRDSEFDLVEEGFEVVFCIGAVRDQSVVVRSLQPYDMAICASPDYLARYGVPQSPEELAHHCCLSFTHWDRKNAWHLLGPDGERTIHTEGSLTVNNGQALRVAALNGIGIVMQPAALLDDDIKEGRLVRILPEYAPPSRPMHLVYRPDRLMTPKVRSFIDFAVDRFGLSD